ncbi:MAG: TolC family protein [Synergistaceae bacterium]|jgi:NodT family efflux transporter outer membrane factor (OMF) lipoprotein|nr:TolC family protein [Synergistaceae bacterium]
MKNRKITQKRLAPLALALVLALTPGAVVPCASAAELPENAPVSRDAYLEAGNWVEIAARRPNPFAYDPSAEMASPNPALLASWWDAFEDETLTNLITWTLWNNRDLVSARSRVMESRASLGIARSALLPWLDNTDSWTHSDTSDNSTSAGARQEISRLGVDASWEIDIFGGRRQDIAAGVAALEADYAALHSTWVTLSSEVALNYLSLRTLQERLAISERNLALQIETLDLLNSRYEAGLSDALAISQARYTVEQTRSAIPPIRAGIEEAMNGIAILAGAMPGSLGETLGEPRPLPGLDAAILAGIPADSLRQRPDIRAAERRLAAQVARRKSAEADLLPRFYLLGSIGLESLHGSNLFSSDSFGFSFGPRITLPIFHGEAIRSNIRVQGEREKQLLAEYEKTVLGAAAEVRDALVAIAQEEERSGSLKAGVGAAKAALEIAEDKYRSGLTDFNNVIGAQRALLSLQEQEAASDGQRASNVVRVFKALGGGWAPITAENSGEFAESDKK